MSDKPAANSRVQDQARGAALQILQAHTPEVWREVARILEGICCERETKGRGAKTWGLEPSSLEPLREMLGRYPNDTGLIRYLENGRVFDWAVSAYFSDDEETMKGHLKMFKPYAEFIASCTPRDLVEGMQRTAKEGLTMKKRPA